MTPPMLRIDMTIRRNSVAILALLSALSCSTNSAIERSAQLLDEGFLRQAFDTVDLARADQLRDYGRVDSDLQEAYERLHFRFLVQSAREEIYADHETRGVELAQEALQLRPGDAEAQALIDRSHHKQAARATARGQEHLVKGELEPALMAFMEALKFEPGLQLAVEGTERVKSAFSRLHREAQQQFLEAIRKWPEGRYAEVDWHATAAITRDPERADAGAVRERAQRELAQQAFERGEEDQAKKQYGAALMEFRTARELWPTLPGIDGFVAQMEREVAAMQTTERAMLAIKSDRFEDASKLLDQAFEQTTLERTTINELRNEIRQRQGQRAYEAARDLELQGLKAEALAAFEALAKDWPDGLLDGSTRISALQHDIAGAEQAFAEGEAAEQKGDLPGALEHYQAAKTYYAKYRDVEARVGRIAAKLAEQGKGGS